MSLQSPKKAPLSRSPRPPSLSQVSTPPTPQVLAPTTKAIVSLALSSGKVVATEKNIAFPNPPVLTLDSVDFTPEITLTKSPYAESAVGVFVNGLMQPPTDYTLSDNKLTFKDPSHYAKGDTVNILYLAAA